jgi:hypothetical protein
MSKLTSIMTTVSRWIPMDNPETAILLWVAIGALLPL